MKLSRGNTGFDIGIFIRGLGISPGYLKCEPGNEEYLPKMFFVFTRKLKINILRSLSSTNVRGAEKIASKRLVTVSPEYSCTLLRLCGYTRKFKPQVSFVVLHTCTSK